MSKYNVTAYSTDRKSGEITGETRVEEIDTVTNIIFKNCTTALEVKRAYESFWNDLNPSSTEVVYVTKVEEK